MFYVYLMKAVVPATDPATGQARDVSLEVWAAQQELPYFEKVSALNQTDFISPSRIHEACK